MIKSKKHIKKKLLFIYISLIIAVFAFFTMYAYRFDVLKILHNQDLISVEISEQTKADIQVKFADYTLENGYMDDLSAVLKEELKDYSWTILRQTPTDDENTNSLFTFFSYGRAGYEKVAVYEQTIDVEMQDANAIIVCYPTLKAYFLYYQIITGVLALLIGGISYVLLIKSFFTKAIRKLYRKKKSHHFTLPLIHHLSTKMLVVNIVSTIIAFSIFTFAYLNRYSFFEFMMDTFYQKINCDEYANEVREEVFTLSMNKANKKIITDYLVDNPLNSCETYLYDENGIYYTSDDRRVTSKFYYNSPNSVTAITTPLIFTYAIPLQDQVGMMLIYSYPLVALANPYQYVVIAIAFSFYLIILLYFIQMKILTLQKIQEDVSILASGDWQHEVKVKGKDEIYELGEHLNQMRISFVENMENEKAARNANKDLISAMSHDLRTPLTTLNGYLEIVQLEKGDKNKREEYIKRCLNKVEEIRDLSDKMFEYSLVFSAEVENGCDMQQISALEINECLNDHIQYLKVLGFHTQEDIAACDLMIDANWSMLKRVFNNLFSNIQKYADKEKPIIISLSVEKNQMKLMLSNGKGKLMNVVESNGIGLKSVRKIVAIHKGECYINDNENNFMIIIKIPTNGGNLYAD